MSVYQPAKSRFWQYDFVIAGKRFYGSTGQATRRSAEAVERTKRLEAATGALGKVAKMTLDQGAGRWWAEVGIERGDSKDVERRIAVLVSVIGADTALGDIDQVTVATAVQARRRQTYRRGTSKKAKTYTPSAATVNRDIIETLRPILKRARTHWTPKGTPHGLPDIDWTELRLSEPRGLSRIYTPAERARWVAEGEAEGVDLAISLILTNGLRFGELFFPLDAFKDDPEEPVIALQKGRKRDVILYAPLRSDHAVAVRARVARARAAGLPHIWYRETARGLVALTYAMLEGAITRAANRAGVTGARRIHGARHHAGNSIMRRSGGNLKAVQGLLGHASIHSSQRYATVLTSELRTMLEDDIPRHSPEAPEPDDAKTKAG